MSGGDRMAVLILAPECGMEGLISRIGRLLGEAGFNPRSAGVIPGARQFVDHIYRTGPTRATDRVQSLPAAFLSYMEYAWQPCAAVLLEHDVALDAQPALARLKGSSRRSGGPEPGTLRALPGSCGPMYSFVHVPDPQVMEAVRRWTTPPLSSLTRSPLSGARLWEHLERVMSPLQAGSCDFTTLRAQILGRCLKTLLLSQLGSLRGLADEDSLGELSDRMMSKGEPSAEGGLDSLRALLLRVRRRLPFDCYAGRRLALLAEAAIWLLQPDRWSPLNIAESHSFMEYAGLYLEPRARQMLLSRMAFSD